MIVSPTWTVLDDLEPGGDVADLAGAERRDRRHARVEKKPTSRISASLPVAISRMRSPDADRAVDDLDVGDHALVRVVVRVEDQRARRGASDRRVGGGMLVDDRFQDLVDADALSLAEAWMISSSSSPMNLPTSCGDPLRIGVGQVDLVDDGDDRQILLERQVDVGHRLRLDALGGVDDEQRAFAGGEAAADLVGEVDVARACRSG